MGEGLSMSSAWHTLGSPVLPCVRPKFLVTTVSGCWTSIGKAYRGRGSLFTPVFLLSCVFQQQWGKVGSHLEHIASRFCLDTETVGDTNESTKELVINPCESTSMSQRWDMVMSWPAWRLTQLGWALRLATHSQDAPDRAQMQNHWGALSIMGQERNQSNKSTVLQVEEQMIIARHVGVTGLMAVMRSKRRDGKKPKWNIFEGHQRDTRAPVMGPAEVQCL